MKLKTVSVHIVTYNSADDIAECLSAVLGQDYPVKNIVVVDNASTDGSAEKVRSFYHELSQGSAHTRLDPLYSVDITVTNYGDSKDSPLPQPWSFWKMNITPASPRAQSGDCRDYDRLCAGAEPGPYAGPGLYIQAGCPDGSRFPDWECYRQAAAEGGSFAGG